MHTFRDAIGHIFAKQIAKMFDSAKSCKMGVSFD